MGTASNRDHFDKIADDYKQRVHAQTEFHNIVAGELEPLIRGKEIIDIGNGGVFAYDYKLAKRVTAMDISPRMLETITDPQINKIVGDARSMDGIPDNSLDVIIINQVLHHVNGDDFQETSAFQDQIIRKCGEKLRARGEIVILEPVLGQPAFRLEKSMFRFMKFLFGALGKGMIFFFSAKFIEERLKENLILPQAPMAKALSLTGWMDPMPALFPGVLRIPTAIYPTTYMIFRAQKQGLPARAPSRG